MKPSVVSRTGTSSRATYNSNYNITQGVCENNMFGNVETNNNHIYSSDDLDTPSDDSDISSSKMLDPNSSDIDSDSLSLPNGQEMDEEEEEKSNLSRVFQGDWPINKTYWSEDGETSAGSMEAVLQQDTRSIMSFDSSMTCSSLANHASTAHADPSGGKADAMLRSTLLSLLQNEDKMEVTRILLEMSSTPKNCIAMMEPGSQCLPLLVQLIHDHSDKQTFVAYRQSLHLRATANRILHNIVFSQPDDKKGRRETRVLRLLEQVRSYCDYLQNSGYEVNENKSDKFTDQQLGPTVAALMKLSFDEEHRHAMCLLGGLQALAELIEIDQEVHGCTGDQYCTMIRRYSGMALTNLTFGDGANKALLCSMKPFMIALVAQLYSPSEELRQVSASVLRNLSWRADKPSKKMLREVGAVTTLMKAAMEASKESTLKSILSALWNLSAHCSENKEDICSMDGALGFLVDTLSYKSGSKNLAVVENCGGILRNISSHIALENDYRIVLRKHNCLQILLHHLKSPSLTVVSNACGTLWNLSARNAQDQRTLWEMGAVSMLKKLMNSKHKMISMGSSAALKNLLSAMPPNLEGECSMLTSEYNSGMPSLHIRKQKILNAEIDQNLAETFDNTDVSIISPTHQPQSRKSSLNRGRHSSLPRQGIPQRVDMKKRNVSETRMDNATEKVTNILDDALSQSPVHRAPDSQPTSPRQIAIINKDSVKNREGFGRQKYTNNRNIPCPPNNSIKETVTMRVSSPGNRRPYSFPSRYDKPRIQSTSPPPVSSRPTANRQIEQPHGRTIQQPQGGIKPPAGRAYYNNLAHKNENTKPEDSRNQEKAPDGFRYMNEALNLSNSSLSDGSKSSRSKIPKIPIPKLNNYMDDGVTQPVATTQALEKAIPHGHVHKGIPRAPSLQSRTQSLETAVHYPQKHLEHKGQQDHSGDEIMHNQRHSLHPKFPGVQKDTELFRRRSIQNCTSSSPSSSSYDLKAAASADNSQPQVQALTKTYEVSPRNFNRTDTGTISRNTDKNRDFVQKKLHADRRRQEEPHTDSRKGGNVNLPVSVNRLQDTPLMFSRSSSLGSISSVEQQLDDNSPVSEFSHQASDGVSPSDLPDSPSQPMAPTVIANACKTKSLRQNANDFHEAGMHQVNDFNSSRQHPPEQDSNIQYRITQDNKIYQKNTIIPKKVVTSKKMLLQDKSPSQDDDNMEDNEETPNMIHHNILKPQEKSNICGAIDHQNRPPQVATNTDRMIKPPQGYRRPLSSKIQKKPEEPAQALDTEQLHKPSQMNVNKNIYTDTSQHQEQSKPFNSHDDSTCHSDVQTVSKKRLSNEPNVYAENVPDKLDKQSFLKTNLSSANKMADSPVANKDFDKANIPQVNKNIVKDVEAPEQSHISKQDNTQTDSSKSNASPARSYNTFSRLPTFSPKKQINSERCTPTKSMPTKTSSDDLKRDNSDYSDIGAQELRSPMRSPEKYKSKLHPVIVNPQYLTYRKHAGPPKTQVINKEDNEKEEMVKDIGQIGSKQDSMQHENRLQKESLRKIDNLSRNKADYIDDTKKDTIIIKNNVEHKPQDVVKLEGAMRSNESSQCNTPEKKTVMSTEHHQDKLNDLNQPDKELQSDNNTTEKNSQCFQNPEESIDLPPDIAIEALKIADDMEAAVDSTEDMCVSTLSCLSDIDTMQPPSVMAELECLSLTSNGFGSDLDQLKSSKVQCSPSKQKSLLKRLHISRLSRDSQELSKCKMSGSTGSLNMDSSSTSEILENINPPSILDDMSFTGSTGSLNSLPSSMLDSRSDDKVVMYASDDSSMNERLCEAAAMVQMYAKEFSNITGNCLNSSNLSSGHDTTKSPPTNPVAEALEDATEHCDTIASDVEFADDLPCDEEDLGSETLLGPQYSSLTKDEQGDGSTENLTVTLTEEPPKHKQDKEDEVDDEDDEDDFIDADQYQALRENADLILNSLKRIHLSESSEFGGLPANDMLEDETLSLVSNDSDDDSLSPDNVFQ